MLQGVVGPKVAATDLKSLAGDKNLVEKEFKGKESDSSFGKALDDKLSTKQPPKETKDASTKDTKAQPQEKEKPEKLAEDPKAKKTETEVVRAQNKPTKKTTGRQQAIQDFMDSFESEFEISPTRLVEAMAQLDNTQLTQSPEDTAEAVIDQLDLAPEDAEKAQAMYAGLLTQLNQMPVAPKAPAMVAGGGMSSQGMQERIMSSQGRQDMMLKSVDQLNQKFWGNPKVGSPEAITGLQTQTMGMPQEGLQNLEVDESSFAMDQNSSDQVQSSMPNAESLLDKLPPHVRGQMKETMSPALLAALAAKQAAAAQQQAENAESSEEPALMDEFQQAVQSPKAEMPMAGAGLSISAKNQASSEQFNQSQQDSSLMQQNSQQNFAKAAGASKEEAVASIGKKADFKQSLTGIEGVHGAPIKGEALKAELGMPMAAPVAPGAAPTQAENEAAVKQLMNQAQYLIKKGGGEMKVQMTPEGMGTIHLKVMLQDGKVNMQMSADTQEAKKTIESSLAELKTSLAAHKLSMENVKVDVVNSASTDTATQNQTNMNGQQQRDQQTRQFWNQFNDNFGSQGRQESMMDMPNLRGYGKIRDPHQPIESASRAPARAVEGKGSGINLVA